MMEQSTKQPRLSPPVETVRRPQASHRRVGLASFGLLLLGVGWIGGNVLPGLQQVSAQVGKSQQASAGTFGWVMRLLHRTPAGAAETASAASASPKADTPAEFANTEVAFVDAPLGLALQMMLISGQYSASADADVSGTVTYSNIGDKKPLMVTVGRVIGASSSEHGVQILHRWDSYQVTRRDINPYMGQYGPMSDGRPAPVPSPTPVPASEGAVTHRLAGVISVQPSPSLPSMRIALLETRVPGTPPQWHVVRQGDPLLRRSSLQGADVTDPTANIDIAPTVESIEPNKIVLRGGGDKRMEIALARQGVVDSFGLTAANTPPSRTDMPVPTGSAGAFPRPTQPSIYEYPGTGVPGRGNFLPPPQRGMNHP